MFDAIRTFFQELASGAQRQDRFEEDDYRLAAAALLIHVLGVDGSVSPQERERLHAVLRARFDLDEAGAEELAAEAAVIEGEAVDFYRFTSQLNRALDDTGRRRIVEMLWEMIYADGRVHEVEDNMAWRIADLLGVPARERVMLRQEVAAAAGGAAADR